MPNRNGETPLRSVTRVAVRSLIGERLFAAFRGLYWPLKLRLTRYEEETAALPLLVPAGAVCLDVGGNFGQYAMALSRAAGPAGTVHSFEPLPYNREVFALVVGRLGLLNVVLHSCAVGAAAGEVALEVPGRNTAETFVDPTGRGERVPMVALDEWVAEQGIRRIDFVKIDVEGFEMDVLRGAEKSLKRFVPVILCEISGISESRYGIAAAAPFEFLAAQRYKAFVWCDREFRVTAGPRGRKINYFFFKDEQESRLRLRGRVCDEQH